MLDAGAADELNATATTEATFWQFSVVRKRLAQYAVNRGYRLERVPFVDLLGFVDCCKVETSSTFGRLLNLRMILKIGCLVMVPEGK